MPVMNLYRDRFLRLLLGLAAAFLALAVAGCQPSSAATDAADAATGAKGAEPAVAERGTIGHTGGEHTAMGHGSVEHRSLAAVEPSDFSVYHVASTWTDQHGTERMLRSLAGRVQVTAMVYTSCAYACPRIMMDMKRIKAELAAEHADDVSFLIVSIDPERDTPERLAQFAAGSRLDPDRWTLLNGSEGDIRELAVLLGVQYRQTDPGEWVHSNMITVLDRSGVVVHRQLGLGTDPAPTLEAIRAAVTD